MSNAITVLKQESTANVKGNAWQQCMFEGPLQTNLSHSFIHIHQMARLVSRLPLLEQANTYILKGYLSLTLPYRGFLYAGCRGPKSEPVKTVFNVKNFIHRFSWSICNDFGAICY